jgi:hypothetical protein
MRQHEMLKLTAIQRIFLSLWCKTTAEDETHPAYSLIHTAIFAIVPEELATHYCLIVNTRLGIRKPRKADYRMGNSAYSDAKRGIPMLGPLDAQQWGRGWEVQ